MVALNPFPAFDFSPPRGLVKVCFVPRCGNRFSRNPYRPFPIRTLHPGIGLLVRAGGSRYISGINQGTDVSGSDPKDMPVSVVVPARNEAGTIGRVIAALSAMPRVDEVVVVDNGSDDDTAAVAGAAGARVVSEARPGMGHAIRAGFIAARHDWVMKVDADLDRFDMSRFARMVQARAPGVGLIKGMWQDPRDPMPMTRYLVMPALRLMFPGLGALRAPNSGLYVFDRSLIALPEITGDYAADLDVMLRVHAAGAGVAEVDIGRVDNNLRDAGHYSAMTDTIMGFFLRQRDLRITDEIVVLAAGAAQVVTGCLGTIAGHARAGGRVSVYAGGRDAGAAAILRAALAPFPTVRIAAPEAAPDHAPSPALSRLTVIAPHAPGAARDAAERLLGRYDPATGTELLLMPPEAGPTDGFRVDVARAIDAGSAIKSAALAQLGRAAPVPPVSELFQAPGRAGAGG